MLKIDHVNETEYNMKIIRTIFFILLILNLYQSEAQVVRKTTKFRASFGLTVFSSDQINNILKNLEDATSQIDQPLNLNRFQTHFQFGLEYEKNIFNNLAAAVSLDYHSDYISGSSYDFRLDIEQVTNYELNYVVLGFSLIYYYPVFQLNSDDARIFGGGSFEYIYSDIDVYYRYIEWATEYNNRIQIRKTGYDEGGRFFGGLEIPVSESIYLQIRTGYAIRNIVDLAKKVDKTEQLPFNQRIIDAKTFDLSSFFVTFGISYFF